MAKIHTSPKTHASLLLIYSERNSIQLDPDYQRNGGIWTLQKRQLLIDSILNEFDIPKLYFHSLNEEQKKKQGGRRYAIIDGRQRLDAIWSFLDNKFPLDSDFEYQDDPKIKLAGLTYKEISEKYPALKIRFDGFQLPIIDVKADDIDLIEDMFSRLNEASPLNASEKRNALGGECVKFIREISKSYFFIKRVRFSNSRYQHYEVATRLILLEDCLIYNSGKIVDTKREYLDQVVGKYRDKLAQKEFLAIKNNVKSIIDCLSKVFTENDELLRSQSSVPIYYLVFRKLRDESKEKLFTRSKIKKFIESVQVNRDLASANFSKADFELLEYSRMSVQGTNDSTSIRERVKILYERLLA